MMPFKFKRAGSMMVEVLGHKLGENAIETEEMLGIPAHEISDKGRLAREPLVSVIVVTYNHEAYIAQNITGILGQKCEFPIEVIIGEDKSTDGTLEICVKYQQAYPEVIRVVTWHENVGISANYLRCIGRARGKYIAILEGDDYWTDSEKLMKQVAVMEQFPRTSICGAKTLVVAEGKSLNASDSLIGQDSSGVVYSLKDVLNNQLFHASTFLLRKSMVQMTKHFTRTVYPDWYLQVVCALHGEVRCLPEVMSVWRHHSGGVCSASPRILHYERCESLCNEFMDMVNAEDRELVKRTRDAITCKRCHLLMNSGNISEARAVASQRLNGLFRRDLLRAMLLTFHMSAPKVYASLRLLGRKLRVIGFIRRFSS